MRLITRPVSQNILVAQLHTDFCGNVRQLIYVLHGKRAAPRQFCHLRQQRRPMELLKRSAPVLKWVGDSDGIELRVRFSNQALDIFFVVLAAVVASLGSDEKRSFGVVRLFHVVLSTLTVIALW